MIDLIQLLQNNAYPGRGIVIGKNCAYYWIMGRSENSRNRVFERTDDGIRTKAFDESKVADPSLIIYHPVRMTDLGLIVTNGDQTDTIADMGDFRAALMTREFEPDNPNFTPRISAVIRKDGTFEIAILKKEGNGCLREFFCYPECEENVGYFISTYRHDGNPLPSFVGEPIKVTLPTSDEVWNALNSDNKISLYAYVNGNVKLYNRHLGD